MFKLFLIVFAALALGLQAVKGLLGGIPAQNGEFPHHVFLKQGRRYFCNGALISTLHVLTSGYCLEKATDAVEYLTATVGSNRMYCGTTYDIGNRLLHPLYYSKLEEKEFDLGIYTLRNYIQTSVMVKPVNLPPSGPIDITVSGKVSSVGSLIPKGPIARNTHMLNVNIIDRIACQNELRCNLFVRESHICTTGTTMNTGFSGNGDDGSPLVQYNTQNSRMLIGIALDIDIPVAQNYPDVYTNISYHSGWINQNIN